MNDDFTHEALMYKATQRLNAIARKMQGEGAPLADGDVVLFRERWPLLAANCGDALDELEAHWQKALDSGAHKEGDWRDLGLVGNEKHRFNHAKAWAEGGDNEDLLGQTGRGLMVSQLRIEAKAAKDR